MLYKLGHLIYAEISTVWKRFFFEPRKVFTPLNLEGFYKVPYKQKLKRLKLTSLEKKRQRGDLIET